MNVLSLCSGVGAADLGLRVDERIPQTLTNGLAPEALDDWYRKQATKLEQLSGKA